MVAYVGAYENHLDQVTPVRVASYKKLLGGCLPSSGGAKTRIKLEELKDLATGLHQVVVYRATKSTQSAFLKKVTGVGDAGAAAAADSVSEGTYVKIECDCEEALRSGGTICPCALAVASAKFSEGNSRIKTNQPGATPRENLGNAPPGGAAAKS
jgi:hypothetical protein